MEGIVKFVYGIFWLAIAIGLADSLVEATNFMRKEAINAHRNGSISYKKFTEELTNQR